MAKEVKLVQLFFSICSLSPFSMYIKFDLRSVCHNNVDFILNTRLRYSISGVIFSSELF